MCIWVGNMWSKFWSFADRIEEQKSKEKKLIKFNELIIDFIYHWRFLFEFYECLLTVAVINYVNIRSLWQYVLSFCHSPCLFPSLSLTLSLYFSFSLIKILKACFSNWNLYCLQWMFLEFAIVLCVRYSCNKFWIFFSFL